MQSELVLVNVTVKDKSGNFVQGLKPENFTILEDNKPQKVVSFDVENVDAVPPQDVTQAKPLPAPPSAPSSSTAALPQSTAAQFKDRRLIVLFFDLSAMEPDEIDHAVTSAEHYVDAQMAPADLVSIVSLGSSLQVNQDFTTDRALLKKQLEQFSSGRGQGFEEGTTGTTEGTPDTGQPFTADDTEYNIFNTDRRLEALRSVAEKLSYVQQKKSLIYFSSGMDRTGIENESELRAAVNAAVRSNMAIYTMDMRGLQALVAGGEAQNASLRGVSAYSGQATLNALNSNFTTQETLVTLASDTGGRAFLDSNDFSKDFQGRAARHVDLLSARLSQHEPRAGRALPPHRCEEQSSRREDRVSPRLLRAGGLSSIPRRTTRSGSLRRSLLLNCQPRICRCIWALPTSAWRATSFSFLSRWWCRDRRFRLSAAAIATRQRWT